MTDREFFERYNRDVYRTCYYMLRNASDAEDVCQEVFMKALTSGWEQVEFLKTWLMRITVNHCLNHLRKKKSRWMKEKVLFLFQREQVEPSILTVVEQKESEDEWKRRLAKLPDKIRIVITLRYTNDLPLADIADILDIPLGTVKSRLNRGLKMMRVILDELEDDLKLPDEQSPKRKSSLEKKEGEELGEKNKRNNKSFSAAGR
ncbi:RNA polymerase sigma factor [Paenibacillus sp. chi10]|uniref:RNA polymerase sigma factor n=1 Tax=Paenibacillus suaedae TaxID=3077233 RepID=A0AAJ2K1F3_9BACL|nr:RNA polymerase sigma factor [Paenibacillus sp. chi10]MDT8978352.1 RNA polymerase sigma factor [Paenibacillus sp. chi10]